MTRIAAICLALLMTSAPLGEAAAQDRDQDRGQRGRPERQRDADSPQFESPRISMAQAAQRASAGRPGRFLGASNRGGTVVVRWEYPGGRVADIMVDARTGRVVGER
jgi:hypothetical protein